VDQGVKPLALEIKSGRTVTRDYFTGLNYWSKLSKTTGKNACLVYGGDMDQDREGARVMCWRSFAKALPGEI
jgi:hypothetical protein